MHPIRSFSLYEFLSCLGMGMTATTTSLLQLQIGMSIADIAFVNIIFWLTVILMELPTGMLADGRGRIWSVRVGITLYVFGCFAYASVQGVGTALIAEITIGIAVAFISGAETAWITDALKKRGEVHLINRAFGTQATAGSVGFLIGGVFGTWVGTFNLRYSWICAALAISASAFVAWRLMDDAGEIDDRPTELEALRLSSQALRGHPELLWSVAAAMVFGLVVSFNHLWQSFFVTDVRPARLGWIWIVIQLSQILAGWFVSRRGSGGANGIVLAIFLAGTGLTMFGIVAGLPALILCVSIHEFGRGLLHPMMDAYTQKRVESRYRATFGSLQSLLSRTGWALALLLVWVLSNGKSASRATIVSIWTISGTLLIIGSLLLWLCRPKSARS